MRHIFTVLRGSIRKSKGTYIGVAVLMFFVSLSLTTVLNVYINSAKRDNEAMEEAGFGDMLGITLDEGELASVGMTIDKLADGIRASEVTGDVDVISGILASLYFEKAEAFDSVYFVNYENVHLKYNQYDENDKLIKTPFIGENEICIPICYRGLYGYNIGDTIYIDGYHEKISLKIVSYFEDPYMGSSLMGVKTVLVSDATMQMLNDKVNEYIGSYGAEIQRNWMQRIYLLNISKSSPDITDADFERELNKDTSYANYCMITMLKNQANTYMMLLVNIFSGIMILFIVILFVVAMIILSHNISSSIEQDYVNLGILKAVGMTNRDIKLYMLIGYSLSAAVGVIVGIPVAIPLIRLMNKLIRASLGLYVSDKADIILAVITVMILTAIISLFVITKSRKVSQIVPVVALNHGRKSVSFSSIFKLPISKRFIQVSLAYRQFISDKKKYISVIMISAILTVFMILMNDAFQWANNYDNLRDLFMTYSYDAVISYKESNKEEIYDVISEYSEFDEFQASSEYLLLDNVLVHCTIIDKPEYFNSVYEGRTCFYDNEIVITKYIADEFKLKIGDTVSVKRAGVEKIFIVSGFYECANDIGKNFAMCSAAYDSFLTKAEENDANEHRDTFVKYLKIKDIEQGEEIKAALKNRFKESEDYAFALASDEQHDASVNQIVLGVDGITVIIYMLSAIFIMITVGLVAKKVIVSEQQDYGIYKAVGIGERKLRSQLAVKFVIVAVAGGLLGIVIEALVGDSMMGLVFSSFGIYNFESSLSVSSLVIPIAFLALLFYVCAYVSARRIKKLEPRMLIVE